MIYSNKITEITENQKKFLSQLIDLLRNRTINSKLAWGFLMNNDTLEKKTSELWLSIDANKDILEKEKTLKQKTNKKTNETYDAIKSIKYKIDNAEYIINLYDDIFIDKCKERLQDYLLGESGYRCSYCKRRISNAYRYDFNIDHILPKDKEIDLIFDLHNLCIACIGCNLVKKNGVKGIIHPNDDTYEDHLEFISFATQSIYYLKYRPAKNDDGKGVKTIEELKFSGIENEELSLNFKNHHINSLNSTIKSICMYYVNHTNSSEITKLMLEMKDSIHNKKFMKCDPQKP